MTNEQAALLAAAQFSHAWKTLENAEQFLTWLREKEAEHLKEPWAPPTTPPSMSPYGPV